MYLNALNLRHLCCSASIGDAHTQNRLKGGFKKYLLTIRRNPIRKDRLLSRPITDQLSRLCWTAISLSRAENKWRRSVAVRICSNSSSNFPT